MDIQLKLLPVIIYTLHAFIKYGYTIKTTSYIVIFIYSYSSLVPLYKPDSVRRWVSNQTNDVIHRWRVARLW